MQGGSTPLHAAVLAARHAGRTVRIGLLEDSEVTRGILRKRLGDHAQLEIAAEAGTIEDALEWLRQESLDAVLVDLHLPDGNGWILGAEIQAARPDVSVFVYTGDRRPSVTPPGLIMLDSEHLADWPEQILSVL